MSTNECVEHSQKGNHFGYGRVFIDGKCQYMHRVVYAGKAGLSIYDIKDVIVRHTCDNPRCINPDHLIPGTRADNVKDMIDRGRACKPRRKLSMEEVNEIRRVYKSGVGHHPKQRCETGQQGLARKYGVNQITIRKIVLGISYREDEQTKLNPTDAGCTGCNHQQTGEQA